MNLKRVWDATEKKIARVQWANWKPCQVWYGLETETYYKQDINGLVEITDEDFNVYWPNWKLVESDDVLGYYDTDEPTDLWNPEDWDEATYTFKDYDETVLKTGKVKDWETPVAPTDPTREGYIFKGWKPKVKAIYKDTTYTAQYEAEPAPSLMNSTYWIENSWTNSLVLFFDGVWDYSQLVNIVVNRSEDAWTWNVSYDFTSNVHEDTPQAINSVTYIFSCVSSDDLDVLLQWDSASVDGTVCTFTSEAMTYINAVYNTSWEEDPDEDTTCQALLTYLEWVAWQGQSILVLPNA